MPSKILPLAVPLRIVDISLVMPCNLEVGRKVDSDWEFMTRPKFAFVVFGADDFAPNIVSWCVAG